MVKARIAPSVALIALVLLSLTNIIPMVVPASASPNPSGLEGWLYRRPITITERSGNDLYNYSVLINADLREAVLEGKMRVDLADLRFADVHGSEIPFWVESYANTSMIYDYSANVGTAEELITYAVVGDRLYGMNAIPLPSRIWVYFLNNGTLKVLYSHSSYRFTAWQVIYNETEGKIYAVGQYYDGSYWRSTIFIIDVNSNTVTYVRHPHTDDVNEFIGVDEYKGYLFVGERNRGGGSAGSSYPNGGGVWRIPKSTITDTSTWKRIWEDPDGREIRSIREYNGMLYVLAAPGEGYGSTVTLYRYNETADTLEEVMTFSDIDASFDYPGFMDDATYLYIALDNSTTGTIHILAFDGSGIVEDFDTGVPNYHSVRILATKIGGEDAIFLGTDRGDIYLVVWGSKRVLRLGEIPMKHSGYGGISRATFNKYAFDPETLTLYPTEAYDSCRLYSVEYGKVKVWVKIQHILASGQVQIYMYYGNPSATPANYTASDVFLFFDDFEEGSLDAAKWQVVRTSDKYGVQKVDNVYALVVGSEGTECALIASATKFSTPLMLEFKAKYLEITDLGMRSGLKYSNAIEYADAFFFVLDNSINSGGVFGKIEGTTRTVLASNLGLTSNTWYTFAVALLDGRVIAWVNETLVANASHSLTYTSYYVWFGEPVTASGDYTDIAVDWVRVRQYVYPEPSIAFGSEELVKVVKLPSNTLILVHDVAYSPNSTQFSHSFTAANTTTASYETNYSDAYGWRVYANPYQSGGVSYENNASLVSEINITLPYSEVLVKNVTLLAKTNGTGNFRQLWIKVLNSTGGVVAELVNATIGTGWTEATLAVNANLGNQITIWINATVKSTTAAGEEIAVKDVRIYVKYEGNPQVVIETLLPNVEFFNCSASHYVELGSTEYLNSSVITIKLIDYLTLNATDYPAEPVYIGNETIDGHVYRVYRVEPANYSQYLTIYALLENRLRFFRTHVKGFDTEAVLVGEPLTIELPEHGNITVVELNETFINVSSVTLRFFSAGAYTVEANLTQASLWRLGYGRKTVVVGYGELTVEPIDTDSRVVDYEDLVLQLINETSGAVVRELVGNASFSMVDLWAGNYTIRVLFRNAVVGAAPFELNVTTDGSTVELPVSMKRLATDYRGVNRTAAWSYDKQLLGMENLSIKYPYSRMRVLLNGTGSFKLYIRYGKAVVRREPAYITVGIKPSSYGGSPLAVYIYVDGQWIEGSNFRVEDGVPKADFDTSLIAGKTIERVALVHTSQGWSGPTDVWIWADNGTLLYHTTATSHTWDSSRPNYFEYVAASYTVQVREIVASRPTAVRVVGNVTGLQYYWDGDYLVVTGTLGSVGEINITDLYRLRLELYDRLGNPMPSWMYAFINGTRYTGPVIEDYLYPEDYVVELPESINGFEFYRFFDGFNATARTVSINTSDITLRAWYRVPTTVREVKSFQVASLSWLPLIKQGGNTVMVYVEGYLVDYYGHGVPNRPVVVNITDVEAGFTWSVNATTDATGYFRTPLLELVRGRTYRVVVSYGGDDVYVGSGYTSELKPEELPAIPAAPFAIEWHYIVAAFAAALILFGIVAALRAAKHVVWEMRSGRRFVKRKQQR